MTTVDPDAFGDLADVRLERLAEIAVEETRLLAEMLPAALGYQWGTPTRRRTEDDPGGKPTGAPSNPTADVALDGDRLALRLQVVKSERVLRHAIIAARGVRRGMERALEAYEGETK